MVEVGEVYRHKKWNIMVTIVDITNSYIIIRLEYKTLLLNQDKRTFLKSYEKLSSLEMELL